MLGLNTQQMTPLSSSRFALGLKVPLGLKFALGIGALVLLSACLPQKAQWTGSETLKRNTVSLVRFSHDVQFAEGATLIGAEETAKIDSFLAMMKVGYGDEISVDGGEGLDADNRRIAVANHLYTNGFHVTPATPVHGSQPNPDTARIIVGRHVVTLPQCPDWRSAPWPNYHNAESSNLGCANVTNLGLMVANPRDLIRGNDLAPPDAEVAAAAVERYHLGEITELEETSTQSTGGSSGNSGS